MGTTDCRQIAEAPDQSELPFMCLQYGMEEAAKHPVPAGKFVRVAASTKACSDYRVVAAWSGFLTFIGTGAFVLGMAIHNEAIAQQQPPRPEPIWLRAEVDMPEQDIYSGPPASRFPYLTCQETPDWRCCRAMVRLVFDPFFLIGDRK